MTTDAKRASYWPSCMCLFGLLLIGIVGCVSSSIRHGDTLDVSRYPSDIQGAYKVFAVRCSRCHTLARPLNARISDPQHWERYVARMRLNSASGINAKDSETILRFLLYYMHQREQEQRDRDQSEGKGEPSAPPPSAASDSARSDANAVAPAAVPVLPAAAAPAEATAPEVNP
jgi:hypothetical protein